MKSALQVEYNNNHPKNEHYYRNNNNEHLYGKSNRNVNFMEKVVKTMFAKVRKNVTKSYN